MGCCKSKPTDAQREQHRREQQQQQQRQQQRQKGGAGNGNPAANPGARNQGSQNNSANRGQGSQGRQNNQQRNASDRNGNDAPKRANSGEVRKPAPNRRGKGRGPPGGGRGEQLDEIRRGRDKLDGGYSDDSFERRKGKNNSGGGGRQSPRRDLAPRRQVDDYEYYYDNDSEGGRDGGRDQSRNNESSGGGFLSSFFGGGDDGDYYSYDASGSDVARDIAYADRLRRDRDYVEAEEMYARCIAKLDIRNDESDYGNEPADPALLPRCLESLADLWADQAEADRDRDRLDDALNYYLRAAKILDGQRGARPLAGAPPRLKAANIQMRIGEKRNAERTYQEVLSQVKRGKNLTPEEEGLEGEALAGLAKAGASRGGGGRGGRDAGRGGKGGGGKSGESPMEIQLKAVQVVRNTYGTGHDKYATAVHELATLELKERKYESALEHFETAAEIRSAALGEENEKTAESRGGMGMALLKLGEKEEAMDLLGEAMSTYDQAYGFDHPMTKMFREAMQSAAR